jgi:hypothetical protein
VQKVAYPKEQMHRFAYTKLTEAEITAKLGPTPAPKSASPLSTALLGKSLRIVTDQGPELSYRFSGNNRLSLAENGGRAVEADYGALTLDNVVLFTHWLPGTQRGYHVIVDQASRLATVFEVWFSGFADNREVQREIYFGYVAEAGKEAPKARHALTNRAEGKGFHWTQDTGVETLELYPSTFYSNFVELSRQGGELGFCAPTDYVKIDDELYVYSRVECEFSGVQTLYVFDAIAPSKSACGSASTPATRSSTTCSKAVVNGLVNSRSSRSSATRPRRRCRRPRTASRSQKARGASTGRCGITGR